VVEFLYLARKTNRRPFIEIVRHPYGRKGETPELLGLLFERKREFTRTKHSMRISFQRLELPFAEAPNGEISIEEARTLFQEEFSIRQDVVDEVEGIAADLALGRASMGIHYRGGTKSREAEMLKRDEMIEVVRRMAPETVTQFYLETDDLDFGNLLRREFPGKEILEQSGVERWEEGTERLLDLNKGDGCQQARKALIDMLLLAKTKGVIKMPSSLSAMIPVICPGPPPPMLLVGNPHSGFKGFPEGCVPTDEREFFEQVVGTLDAG